MIMEYNKSMQIAAILPVMAFRIKWSIFPWTSLALIRVVGGSCKNDQLEEYKLEKDAVYSQRSVE